MKSLCFVSDRAPAIPYQIKLCLDLIPIFYISFTTCTHTHIRLGCASYNVADRNLDSNFNTHQKNPRLAKYIMASHNKLPGISMYSLTCLSILLIENWHFPKFYYNKHFICAKLNTKEKIVLDNKKAPKSSK